MSYDTVVIEEEEEDINGWFAYFSLFSEKRERDEKERVKNNYKEKKEDEKKIEREYVCHQMLSHFYIFFNYLLNLFLLICV